MVAISTVLKAAGTVMSAIGALRQGAAAEDAAQANTEALQQRAALQQEAAQRERDIAAVEESDERRRQSRLIAAQRALLGASGVDPSQGTPLLVAADTAAQAERQALRIRRTGEARAVGQERSAFMTRREARLERLRGRQARSASRFRAGAQLLRGGGSLLSPSSSSDAGGGGSAAVLPPGARPNRLGGFTL